MTILEIIATDNADNASLPLTQQKKLNRKLMSAAKEYNFGKATKLISQGADIFATDKENRTVFHYAAEFGDTDCMENLIQLGMNIESKSHSGMTALHHATRYGNVDSIQFLLNHGADINAVDSDGRTVSHWLVLCGRNTKYIEKLAEQGADMLAKDRSGKTPYDYLEEYSHAHFVERKKLNKAFLMAVETGDLNGMKRLHREGSDINTKDEFGDSALHLSVLSDRAECIQYLLSNNADINIINDGGNTVLYQAAINENIDCINLLLNNGIDISLTNLNGHTALDVAKTYGKQNSINAIQSFLIARYECESLISVIHSNSISVQELPF